MDNKKRLIIALILAFGLTLAWDRYIAYLRVKNNWQTPGQPAKVDSSNVASSTAPATQPATASTVVGPAPSITTAPVTGIHPAEGTLKQITLGSGQKNDPTYAMLLRLSTRGAGIEEVVLNEFSKAVKSDDRYTFET